MIVTRPNISRLSIQHGPAQQQVYVGALVGISVGAFPLDWIKPVPQVNVVPMRGKPGTVDAPKVLRVAIPANDNMTPTG